MDYAKTLDVAPCVLVRMALNEFVDVLADHIELYKPEDNAGISPLSTP
jgi:hypothetical protein